MKLASVEHGGSVRVGALLDGAHLLDLDAAHTALHRQGSPAFADMLAFIDGGEAALALAADLLAQASDAAVRELSNLRLRAPLPEPRQIRDCLVFEQHLKNSLEQGRKLGLQGSIPSVWYEQPIYYKGNRFTVVGPDAEVRWPRYAEILDYELELACIIGRTGVDIAPENAMGHVFGFTIFNDVSARDAQMREMAGNLGPAKGKDFDTGNVLGPWIVTRDEIGDPYDLTMVARVNGEEWSRGNSGSMHHRFEAMIAHISMSETLHAGEVIGSGTVGTGCGLELGRFPQPGDVIELEIEKIGILRNRFVR